MNVNICNQQPLSYSPLILVDTADLPKSKWLEYRRKGIGGSDAAAVLGISPWMTARDLYDDKLNIASAIDNESNWVAMEIGNLLEALVAKIFQTKTGYQIFKVNKMFYHPEHTFMLADVDFFVRCPDGSTAILEIKTTNYNAKANWWHAGKEIVPIYYEAQGRHYMAVTNIDRVFYCCLYGNSESEVIIREIRRDMEYEAELITLEKNFWSHYILKRSPPPYTENIELIIKSVCRRFGYANPEAPTVMLDKTMAANVAQYVLLQEQKKTSDMYSKKMDLEMKRLKAILIAEMGTSCTAYGIHDGVTYVVTYSPIVQEDISKNNLLRLKLDHPDVYSQYVTKSTSRRFNVKKN